MGDKKPVEVDEKTELKERVRQANFVGRSLLDISKKYIVSLSDSKLEECAKEEEKIFYEGAPFPVDICQNAYSQYENVIDKTEDFLLLAMRQNYAEDGLGRLATGCRLTGEKCTAAMEFLEDLRFLQKVKVLIPEDYVTGKEIVMNRGSCLIIKEIAEKCVGHDLTKKAYESALVESRK